MILDKIVTEKRKRVELLKEQFTTAHFEKLALEAAERASFYEALKKPGLSIIGEVKKASPSKGLIKPDFDYINIAKDYSKCVDAISVLTEEDFFLGSPKYLKEISETITTPLLRKDFIIDPIQIYEAKVIGASAILLIAGLLDKETVKRFREIAKSLGLDALVETHNMEELEIALGADADIVGINNRDLKTFEVSLENTMKIAREIPKGKIIVSESGIDTIDDIKYL